MAVGVFTANFSADRTPQGISHARVEGFNAENVRKFFDLCEPDLGRSIHNRRLLGVDETGTTVVRRKHNEAVSLKGKKEVGKLTSGKTGRLITGIT
jgi:hypothetical protein